MKAALEAADPYRERFEQAPPTLAFHSEASKPASGVPMGRIRPLAANLPLPAAGLSEEGWADAGQLVSATKRARETIQILNDVGRTMPEIGFRRLDGHLPRG